MSREKSNAAHWTRLGLLVLLLVVCVLVGVGSAWARYQTSSRTPLNYTVGEIPGVYLWSGYDPGSGTLYGEESTWYTTDEGKALDFYISNGTGDGDFADDAQWVTIRLFASLGAQTVEDPMQVTLQVGETTCSGRVSRVMEGTQLYKQTGDGWLITFFDESGKEMSWPLEGGTLSVLSCHAAASNVKDNSLLQLQVGGTVFEQ